MCLFPFLVDALLAPPELTEPTTRVASGQAESSLSLPSPVAASSPDRAGQDIGDGGGQMEGHDLADLLGDILEVGPLRTGRTIPSAGSVRSQHLLLDPPSGAPDLQGDSAGHGDD